MALRYLQDTYGVNPDELTSEDMAIIVGAYRAGIESYGGDIEDYQNYLKRQREKIAAGDKVYLLGPQAILAYPLAEYFTETSLHESE